MTGVFFLRPISPLFVCFRFHEIYCVLPVWVIACDLSGKVADGADRTLRSP